MRTTTLPLLTAIAVALGAACGTDGPTVTGQVSADSLAMFRVTFNATWGPNTHPISFPPNAHFSGLIGATHDSTFVMWAVSGLASTGMKNMAELGSKPALTAEVDAAIQAGAAWGVLSGGGINPSPASVDLIFDAHARFPLVSLVSMIAPSPDWFVGVANLNLMQGGVWRDSVTVELFAYDAGTDGGTTYTSPNSAATPPEPIRSFNEAPFTANVPLGTFTFIRQ